MKRDRLSRGWSLRNLAAQSGFNLGTLSQTETGKRPMSAALAAKMDELFPERQHWYTIEREESKSWVPASFRSWAEYEDRATVIRAWSPSFIHGLLQTADYARAQLSTALGVTPEVIDARLASRLQRQQRVLFRDDPPEAWFVVDEPSLYRLVGSPGVMADQMRHLANIARMPSITLQVLPSVAHPVGASGLTVTQEAAYAEHVLAGGVYTEGQTVRIAQRLITTLVSESNKSSDSVATIGRTEKAWKRLVTGGRRPTATRTGETA